MIKTEDSLNIFDITAVKPDVNSIPLPAKDLLPFRERYLERILTSRGCGFSCAFCSSRRFWGDFRARNVDNIIEEMISVYKERGLVPISFADDSFTYDRERVMNLCDEIKNKGIKTAGLGFSSHPSKLDNELLLNMRSAGFDSMFLGLESGSDKILEIIGKKYNRTKVEDSIKFAVELGFQIHASFMIGLPKETEDDIKLTLNWAEKLPVHSVGFHIFYPFHGCDIRENPQKYQIRILENDTHEGDIDGEAVIQNGVLSPNKILDYYYKARALAKYKTKGQKVI